MAVTTENVTLGVCDAVFGATDLGATKGGVTVKITTNTHEVKVDQYGDTPIKDIITGTIVEVTVPMAETDLDRLKAMMPQSSAVTASSVTVGVLVTSGVNTDLLDYAGQLKLHPTGVASNITKEDFIAFKAAPIPSFTFKYSTDEERVYEVTFRCYPDIANSNRICVFGKTST